MGDGTDHDPAGAEGIFRTAFARAEVGIAVLNAGGTRLRDANPALCALLGYPAGALAGCPLADLIGPGEEPGEGIRSWRRADGVALDVRVRGTGPVLTVEAVDPDAAAHSEENHEALAAAGLGEWRWERASGRVILSRRAGQILGHPAGTAPTWDTLRRAVPEEAMERLAAAVRASLADGVPYAFEGALRRLDDGRTVVVASRGQPVRGPDGTVTGLAGVVQDITTRVQARDELVARDHRLRAATSIARLGIFEWHMLEDQALWENERMFEIFGRTPEDGTIGKSEFLDDILHPDDRDRVRTAISRALREDDILHVTGRVRRKSDGAWRTIDMAGRFERDAPNRLPRRLIGVVADVTDRRTAEERQTLLIRELHHRVKNTLATVQAIVGSTARTASSIESFYEAFVGRIKSLAHTHTVLTEDTWQTANLRDLLVNELKPYAESEAADAVDGRVVLEGPDLDLPSEMAVPVGMAIHELTTNAAKYGALSNRRGRVTVTWSLEPGEAAGILHFRWRESGGPPVQPPRRQGFGSRLLQRVLTAQVQAQVETDYAPEGFSLSMRAPLPGRTRILNPLAG
ncbi:HWE histidine kinase domain-containing protein [Methylobacterium gregans]|uniref:Blue-light-activated histidine kinase n=1 Tax=Methylobacterium gregans TaxID=374424 RepID=A0AA37MBT5_9HYPH|nr:HWE histidine kinase domain-containing protein [Methylobacterium gregans]MDQ0523532.1 PAS domain S-box-containing protein [Methylobacterium gregans]GJD80280.1 hypothetical protein NBEOAGPD_3521 [Methylobacterium gregans]GLS55881.1 hypothetical protein GCM10007886_40660 [Methylobacterium gregans]